MGRVTLRAAAGLTIIALVAGCSGGGLFGRSGDNGTASEADQAAAIRAQRTNDGPSSFFDLFNDQDDPNVTLEVNRYIWSATLDVLSFLPVQNADPFSGVIQFGFGRPPGGGQAYQATVLIQDPSLDARSLNVALRTQSGPVGLETQRAIEDAILSRARQLRIRDSRL